MVKSDGLKIRWRNPRGFEPHSVHNPCSSMAEQLPFQANDGGSIPSMDALVDAKTTIVCLSEGPKEIDSSSIGEIRAGSNPATHKQACPLKRAGLSAIV